jgi:hypothetical protein
MLINESQPQLRLVWENPGKSGPRIGGAARPPWSLRDVAVICRPCVLVLIWAYMFFGLVGLLPFICRWRLSSDVGDSVKIWATKYMSASLE